jgi:hypothetical protein
VGVLQTVTKKHLCLQSAQIQFIDICRDCVCCGIGVDTCVRIGETMCGEGEWLKKRKSLAQQMLKF